MFLLINLLVALYGGLLIKKHIGLNQGDRAIMDNPDSSISPLELNFLYKNNTYINRAILVNLLDLYNRGNINIERYSRESRNKRIADFVIEYRLELLSWEGLLDHEKFLLENIFQDKVTSTTDQLTERAKTGRNYYSQLEIWAHMVEDSLYEKGLYGDKKGPDLKATIYRGLGLMSLGLVTLISGRAYGLVNLFLSFGIFLAAINIKMKTSDLGASLLKYYHDMEEDIKSSKKSGPASQEELLNILALGLPMKYFLPIYMESKPNPGLDLVALDLNPSGGSYLDDAILRAFMKFTEATREDSIDTNRIDIRLFK